MTSAGQVRPHHRRHGGRVAGADKNHPKYNVKLVYVTARGKNAFGAKIAHHLKFEVDNGNRLSATDEQTAKEWSK
jgi:hypothetical protein